MLSVRVFAVAGATLAALLAAASAQAQVVSSPIGSEAYGISATFSSQTLSTALGPVNEVAGALPPAYSKTLALGSYDGSIAIPPLVPASTIYPMVASFTAQAQTLVSHVASTGTQLDSVSATGQSQLASADLRIVGPISTTAAEPFLSVYAIDVADSASYSKVFPDTVTVTGSASFGALTIGGTLVGGTSITYSGSVPPNTILYQSPTTTAEQTPAVTIIANQQITFGLITCSPSCTFVPASLTVHALDISLHNAPILGHLVTGDIVLGDAAAH